jgi:hypothetical protein
MKLYGSICISTALRDKCGIPVQDSIRIRVGSIEVLTRLVCKEGERCTYMLSPELSRALLLHKSRRLQIRYDSMNDHIHLGPTIGILAVTLTHRGQYDPTSVKAELIYLSHVSRSLSGQIYIFTPGSINWENKTTRGYTFQKGNWASATYPLPDVVYDRITSRATEAKNLTTKQKLMQLPHLKYFNPSFFNKWQVYQMLVTDPQLKRYLPETKDLTPENFKGMLQKYNTLFVKPSNGSLGKGIIKVTRNSGGAVSFVIYGKGKVKNYAENAEEFFKKTTRIRGDKPYIVQQGLNLALYKGATFDLRIIYQKNKEGNWQLGKKFVRVAPRGSSISNLSSGGRVEISKRVLKYLFHNKERIENKNEEIKEFCLRVAKILEEKNNAIYGELGMDIGIDKQGALWLIEVNSKPRKTTETEFSTAVMRRTFLRPLEFASYLAGFPVK